MYVWSSVAQQKYQLVFTRKELLLRHVSRMTGLKMSLANVPFGDIFPSLLNKRLLFAATVRALKRPTYVP
jgi:hypothetical protein